MEGIVIVPFFYKYDILEENEHFLAYLVEKFGFEIQYFPDFVNIRPNTDIIITWKLPSRALKIPIKEILDAPRHIKVILYCGDLHSLSDDNKDFYKVCDMMFDRADVILFGGDALFRKMFADFLHKYIHFPNFFAPHLRYISLNEDPVINKCLISGLINDDFYPLRSFVRDNVPLELLTRIPHPGYRLDKKKYDDLRNNEEFYFGDRYAALLNSHVCCFTCTAVWKLYALSKHFEIPAARSIMLSDTSLDLLKCGFIPDVHYVEVDKINVVDKIKDVLTNFGAYEKIRNDGCEFVRAKHSIENRKKLFEKILTLL